MAVAPSERGIAAQTPVYESGRKPLWNEIRAAGEFFNIQFYPVYYGIGVSHDHQSPVLTIPGFTGNDLSLFHLNTFLTRINYKVYFSKIFYHRDPEREIEVLSDTVERIYKNEGKKVHLVGHSLGGIVARGIAYLKPHAVASVNALGSPIGDFEKDIDPFVLTWAKIIVPSFNNIEELKRKKEQLSLPIPKGIKTTYIYTKEDGVVHWRSTLSSDPQVENIEVPGTHLGLVANPHVYRHLANSLSFAA